MNETLKPVDPDNVFRLRVQDLRYNGVQVGKPTIDGVYVSGVVTTETLEQVAEAYREWLRLVTDIEVAQ